MNTETLTQKLHAKADAELRARINNYLAPIWKELRDQVDKQRGKQKWPGDSGVLFDKEVVDYLLEGNRDLVVADFMAKVESMANQMEELGLVIADNAGRGV